MYSSDTKGQILIPSSSQLLRPGTRTGNEKASIANHIAKLVLVGELLDALDEILVAVAVGGDDLADQRDRGKAPPLVEGIKGPVFHLAELETGEDAAGPEDAVGLAQGNGLVGEVADAEGDGVEIDGVVFDGRQVFGVGFDEGEAWWFLCRLGCCRCCCCCCCYC